MVVKKKEKAPKKAKAAAKVKVPLNDMLLAMDTNDYGFYERLSKEQKKVFSPWLVMRYASSCKGDYKDHYLIMTNSFVNHEFSSLSDHPNLQWKLIALCGVGFKQFHPWQAPPKKGPKSKLQVFLSTLHPGAKLDELEMLETLYTTEELKDAMLSKGMTDKEIKDLL